MVAVWILFPADSVGVMSDGWTVRLRDFSCAIDESRATSDDGDIADILCSALPPIIVSPEVFLSRHSVLLCNNLTTNGGVHIVNHSDHIKTILLSDKMVCAIPMCKLQ